MQFIEYYTESKKHNNNPSWSQGWLGAISATAQNHKRQYHTAYGKHQNSKFSRYWKSIAFASSETQKKKKKK